MNEIRLAKRVKYAGDIHTELLKSGWDLESATTFVNNIPDADVAPVVHGRWIDKGEYAICMECCERSGTQYNGVEPIPLMTQFCPNCGARMDGDER